MEVVLAAFSGFGMEPDYGTGFGGGYDDSGGGYDYYGGAYANVDAKHLNNIRIYLCRARQRV
jgi:hypothetical protein